jgi:hypothetical protein
VSPEDTRPSMNADPHFSTCDTSESHLITQAEFYSLVQDLDLYKTKTQLFGSTLKLWSLLDKSVIISFYRKRQTRTYYSMDGDLVYCNNNQELTELQLEHTLEQLRLFTDTPKVSLKAVLLHNGNTFLSIPLTHAIHKRECT